MEQGLALAASRLICFLSRATDGGLDQPRRACSAGSAVPSSRGQAPDTDCTSSWSRICSGE